MSSLEQARSHFEAGEYRAAHDAAAEALGSSPDDAGLLQLAGRAGVELGEAGAVDQLRKVTELKPDDAEAWTDLGDALATEGQDGEAATAFKKALELDPENETALTHLGHTAFAAGDQEEAVSYLSQAADQGESRMSTAAISLVEMYKTLGQREEALAAAQKVAEADPGDVGAALDVAELSLEGGELDEARSAFERVREIDDLDEHEVYALHGMILVELKRDNASEALDLARQAKAIDTVGRTTGVFAHLESEAGGDGDDIPRDMSAATISALEAPPSRDEVEQGLESSLKEHRLLHAEDNRITSEGLDG